MCNALEWKEETAGMCCSGDKVTLPSLGKLEKPLIYYRIGSLFPPKNNQHIFLQIYLMGDGIKSRKCHCSENLANVTRA